MRRLRALAPLVAAALVVTASCARADTLHVLRLSLMSEYRYQTLDRDVRDPEGVARFARIIAGLPAVDPGRYFCPIDFGLRYRLDLRGGALPVLSATAEAGGCRFLELPLGEFRATTDEFWDELAALVGMGRDELLLRPQRAVP